jgi:hypothetical protein
VKHESSSNNNVVNQQQVSDNTSNSNSSNNNNSIIINIPTEILQHILIFIPYPTLIHRVSKTNRFIHELTFWNQLCLNQSITINSQRITVKKEIKEQLNEFLLDYNVM